MMLVVIIVCTQNGALCMTKTQKKHHAYADICGHAPKDTLAHHKTTLVILHAMYADAKMLMGLGRHIKNKHLPPMDQYLVLPQRQVITPPQIHVYVTLGIITQQA